MKSSGCRWSAEKIGSLPVALIDGDRSAKYPKRSEFQAEGVVFLNAESISAGSLDLGKVNYISEDKYSQITKGRLRFNDLIITMRGNGVGDVALFAVENVEGLINAQMLIIRPEPQSFDSRFLYYQFINPAFKRMLMNYVSGSAQPQLTITHLKHVPLSVPPLNTQKAIAHILGTLDDKIELNRQMNATLEAIAQTLFKSWFVDFDPVIDNALAAGNPIPEPLQKRAAARKALGDKRKPLPEAIRNQFCDRFVFNNDLGWVPEGWDTSTLEGVTKVLRRGISPKYLEEGGVRVINQKCIRDHSVNFSLTRRNDPEKRKIAGREIKVGDVLVNSTGVGTLGRMAQVKEISETTVVDSHVTVVRPNSDFFQSYVFGQAMLNMEARVEAMGIGSTGQTELSRANLQVISILVPPLSCQQSMEKQLATFAQRQVAVMSEISELSQLRDTLLPKLLSGQLHIPEAEKLVAEVV